MDANGYVTAVRVLVAGVATAAAVAAIECLSVQPFVCNRLEARAEAQTVVAFEEAQRNPGSWRAIRTAREVLKDVTPCLNRCSANANLHMIAAANYRILRRFDDATQHYRAALRYDRRPEIYFNLGLTLLDQGKREDAIHMLVVAGRSGYLFNLIPDESIRGEVEQRLRDEWAERIRGHTASAGT